MTVRRTLRTEAVDTNGKLRLSSIMPRDFGSRKLIWAHLLYRRLAFVDVYVIYFPSRFDLNVDKVVEETLREFGTNTGKRTSVNFWDAKDPDFTLALNYFHEKSPPVLVFVAGLAKTGLGQTGLDESNLYSITISDQKVLGDRLRLASITNTIHEMLVRSDPREIASFVKRQSLNSLLATIGRISMMLKDQFLSFKPKFQLPDGTSIQFG